MKAMKVTNDEALAALAEQADLRYQTERNRAKLLAEVVYVAKRRMLELGYRLSDWSVGAYMYDPAELKPCVRASYHGGLLTDKRVAEFRRDFRKPVQFGEMNALRRVYIRLAHDEGFTP